MWCHFVFPSWQLPLSWSGVTVIPANLVSPARTSSLMLAVLLHCLCVEHISLLSQSPVFIDQSLSSPRWPSHATEPPPSRPSDRLSTTSGHPFTWAVRIMKAWFQYFPSFLCSLLCGLMQIPNFNKQLLNMSLTLLGLQMRLCYWDHSMSCSFVMSFVNHSWPAVYRMELRLSSFFLWLLSFFSERITILLPKRLITCTNKRVSDINTKFTGFSLSQTCNSLYISS